MVRRRSIWRYRFSLIIKTISRSDCEFGLIRRPGARRSAAAYEGARLRGGPSIDALDQYGERGLGRHGPYRSKANEEFAMEKNGFVSRVHRQKAAGSLRHAGGQRAAPTTRNRKSAPVVEHVSRRPERLGWTCSSAPSGLRARRRRSDWRTSFTTSNDCSFCGYAPARITIAAAAVNAVVARLSFRADLEAGAGHRLRGRLHRIAGRQCSLIEVSTFDGDVLSQGMASNCRFERALQRACRPHQARRRRERGRRTYRIRSPSS